MWNRFSERAKIPQTFVPVRCQTQHQFGTAPTRAGNTRRSLTPSAYEERKMASNDSITRPIIAAGARFAKWTVVSDRPIGTRPPLWLCRCVCGTERMVNQFHLISGDTQCCGCFRKHGQCHNPVYRIGRNMKDRCSNQRHKSFDDYGGRGIRVCERWEDFAAFFEDMGNRPTPEHSIERIDNNGHYCKENCRWATAIEQQRNKRNSRLIEFDGRVKCLSAWAEEFGIEMHLLYLRLKKGWDIQPALTYPPRKGFRPKGMMNDVE
jgi:hypothetical protein